MKNLFKLLLLSLIFTACEDVEPAIYNGAPEEGTFLSFSRNLYTLPIVRDADGSAVITLNSSTVSNVDRVYNLDIDEAASTANTSTYVFPSTITIPAGSYQGFATVTGTDGGLVDDEVKTVVFSISNITNEDFDQNLVTLNVVEVCPLLDDFTGQYVFHQDTAPVMNGSTPIFLFPQDGIVNVEMGETEFDRVFTSQLWAAFFNETVDFTFSLNCGVVNVEKFDIGYGCTGGGPFTIDAAAATGFYTPGDDTEITVIVSEDATGSCLSNARTVTFTLTKVE